MRGAIAGMRLIPEALRLLLRHRTLWPLAAAPVGLTVLFVAGVLAGVVQEAAVLHAWVAGWLPIPEAGAWYTWLWVGPARLLVSLAGYALFGLAVGLLLVLAFGLANLVSSPLLDQLSQRVERIETGRLVESGEKGIAGLLRESGRSILNELRRLAFFALVWLVIAAAGLVVPGAQPLTPLLLTGVTILFLPLDYGGYVMDRRGVPFRRRRAWLLSHVSLTAGFGGAAFVTFLVPGLNFLLLPTLVTAGTLLAVRCPAAGVSRESRGAPAGTTTSP